jgi:hypothetical protein
MQTLANVQIQQKADIECTKCLKMPSTAGSKFTRWFAEPISSTLKMEAICSSETSVETQRTTWRHIPEDDTLQSIFCFRRYERKVK